MVYKINKKLEIRVESHWTSVYHLYERRKLFGFIPYWKDIAWTPFIDHQSLEEAKHYLMNERKMKILKKKK